MWTVSWLVMVQDGVVVLCGGTNVGDDFPWCFDCFVINDLVVDVSLRV